VASVNIITIITELFNSKPRGKEIVASRKLENTVAIVTGASKGIGAAIAKQMGAVGASVVVNYASDKAGAARVADPIREQGGQALAVQADLTRPEDIERLLAETHKAFGRLDTLVNNAGIYEVRPLDQVTPEHFHKQFDLNVLGLVLASKEALKYMGETGGSIINASSVAATYGGRACPSTARRKGPSTRSRLPSRASLAPAKSA